MIEIDSSLAATFATLAGYIIGLGAVTVIDTLGFFGRRSSYWTETTIRAHKVTKPLIWLGIVLKLLGEYLLFLSLGQPPIFTLLFMISGILIANGCFLSFYISPILLKREKEGNANEVLPLSLQKFITASFLISFFGWWGSVAIISYLVNEAFLALNVAF